MSKKTNRMPLFRRKNKPLKLCSSNKEKELIKHYIENCIKRNTTEEQKRLIEEAFESACFCKHSKDDKFDRADRLKNRIETGIKNILEALDEIDDTTNRELYNFLLDTEVYIQTKQDSIKQCMKNIEMDILAHSSFSPTQLKNIKQELAKYLKSS